MDEGRSPRVSISSEYSTIDKPAVNDPFHRRHQRESGLTETDYRSTLLDYDKLNTYINRIIQIKAQLQAAGMPVSSPLMMPQPPTNISKSYSPRNAFPDSLSASSPSRMLSLDIAPPLSSTSPSSAALATSLNEKMNNLNDRFWSEVKRQIEQFKVAYVKYEKFITAKLNETAVENAIATAALPTNNHTALTMMQLLVADHPNLAQTLQPSLHINSDSDEPIKMEPTISAQLKGFIHLVRSVDSLRRYVYLNYFTLWTLLTKYHKHTNKPIDQRLLSTVFNEPFAPATKIASVLTRIHAVVTKLVSSISIKTEQSVHHHANEELTQTCPLCLNPLSAPLVLSCSHQFCLNCIVRQPCFGQSCPTCKSAQSIDSHHIRLNANTTYRAISANKTVGAKAEKHSLSVPPITIPPHHGSEHTSAPVPSSPGPNSSPTSSAAFAAFFAANYKPKRGQGVSCHQCKTNKDPNLLLFCGNRAEKGVRKRRCRKKYCETCLRRSYSLAVLVREDDKDWHCPSCLNACCCAACQRRDSPMDSEGTHGSDGASEQLAMSPMTLPATAQPPSLHDDHDDSANNTSEVPSMTLSYYHPNQSPPLMPSLEPLVGSPITPDCIDGSSVAHEHDDWVNGRRPFYQQHTSIPNNYDGFDTQFAHHNNTHNIVNNSVLSTITGEHYQNQIHQQAQQQQHQQSTTSTSPSSNSIIIIVISKFRLNITISVMDRLHTLSAQSLIQVQHQSHLMDGLHHHDTPSASVPPLQHRYQQPLSAAPSRPHSAHPQHHQYPNPFATQHETPRNYHHNHVHSSYNAYERRPPPVKTHFNPLREPMIPIIRSPSFRVWFPVFFRVRLRLRYQRHLYREVIVRTRLIMRMILHCGHHCH